VPTSAGRSARWKSGSRVPKVLPPDVPTPVYARADGRRRVRGAVQADPEDRTCSALYMYTCIN
jgi:hypothetical protein